MSSQRYSLHIHVMDESQSQMWHQPMRPLRDWYQEELIIQVQEAADEARVCGTNRGEKWHFRGAGRYNEILQRNSVSAPRCYRFRSAFRASTPVRLVSVP